MSADVGFATDVNKIHDAAVVKIHVQVFVAVFMIRSVKWIGCAEALKPILQNNCSTSVTSAQVEIALLIQQLCRPSI